MLEDGRRRGFQPDPLTGNRVGKGERKSVQTHPLDGTAIGPVLFITDDGTAQGGHVHPDLGCNRCRKWPLTWYVSHKLPLT